MKRILTKYGIYILSILAANLLADLAIEHLFEFAGSKSYSTVWKRMGIIVLIFMPVMKLVESSVEKVSKKYIQHSKKVSKNSVLGLIIGFMMGLLGLFVAYAYIWYDLKIWKF